MPKASELTKSVLLFLFEYLDWMGYVTFDIIASQRPFYRDSLVSQFSTYSKYKVNKTIHNLKQRGLIKNENQIILTPKGIKYSRRFKIEKMQLVKQDRWDRKWRIVIWDIPEQYRAKRDFIRGKLKQLKFVRIQKSIWVTPWPCQEEVSFLRDEIKLANWLIYIEADHIEGAEVLMSHFKINIDR